MKDNKKVDTSRRDLLKGIATAAVASTVVAGTAQASSPAAKEVKVEDKKTGYRETQHIRDYYDTL